MLGTDIWAANTFDSFSGVTWDSQPEKLDFTQFHRKLRNTSKHPLPHIDREGLGKGKYEDGNSINLNDIEKVLPVWQRMFASLRRSVAWRSVAWRVLPSSGHRQENSAPLQHWTQFLWDNWYFEGSSCPVSNLTWDACFYWEDQLSATLERRSSDAEPIFIILTSAGLLETM
ncbi:uncharacterized protein [Patagioenas fasciata]